MAMKQAIQTVPNYADVFHQHTKSCASPCSKTDYITQMLSTGTKAADLPLLTPKDGMWLPMKWDRKQSQTQKNLTNIVIPQEFQLGNNEEEEREDRGGGQLVYTVCMGTKQSMKTRGGVARMTELRNERGRLTFFYNLWFYDTVIGKWLFLESSKFQNQNRDASLSTCFYSVPLLSPSYFTFCLQWNSIAAWLPVLKVNLKQRKTNQPAPLQLKGDFRRRKQGERK